MMIMMPIIFVFLLLAISIYIFKKRKKSVTDNPINNRRFGIDWLKICETTIQNRTVLILYISDADFNSRDVQNLDNNIELRTWDVVIKCPIPSFNISMPRSGGFTNNNVIATVKANY